MGVLWNEEPAGFRTRLGVWPYMDMKASAAGWWILPRYFA